MVCLKLQAKQIWNKTDWKKTTNKSGNRKNRSRQTHFRLKTYNSPYSVECALHAGDLFLSNKLCIQANK